MKGKFQSRIFSDNYYENAAKQDGWVEQEFAEAIGRLESMNREQLVSICKLPEIELSFISEGWEQSTPLDEIIGALIADYPPEAVKKAIASLEG